MQEAQILSLFSEEWLFLGLWFGGLLGSGLLMMAAMWACKALGDLCWRWERRRHERAINKLLKI